LLVSLWFRRSYERVLQQDTNVGTGTLAHFLTWPLVPDGPFLAPAWHAARSLTTQRLRAEIISV